MRRFRFAQRWGKEEPQSQSGGTPSSTSVNKTQRISIGRRTSLSQLSDKSGDLGARMSAERAPRISLGRRLSLSSRPGRNATRQPAQANANTATEAPPEMRKRRVIIPIFVFDNPHLTETEFMVDVRYKRIRSVGSGRFGVVVSAFDSQTGARVAIKKILGAFSSAHAARHVLRELRLLRRLRHPHIVSLLDVDIPRNFKAWDSVYLVTPLLATDLRTAMLRGRIRDRRTQKRILAQILCALQHMHAARTMHRDIKSLNVLLDDKLNAKICDLGEARYYSCATTEIVDAATQAVEDTELTVGPRTILHSAPELFLNESYNASVDVWGVGCIAAEMLHPKHAYLFDDETRRNPFKTVVDVIGFPTEEQMAHLEKRSSRWYMSLVRKKNREGTLRKMLAGGSIGDDSKMGWDFVERCLKFSPKERMTAKEAFEHPFLAEVAEEVIAEVDANLSEQDEVFDFQLTEPPENASKAKLKDLVWEEVVAFHPEAALMGIH